MTEPLTREQLEGMLLPPSMQFSSIRELCDTALHYEARLREVEAALLDTYWLIREGEPDNALHGLDAFLIRHGINPEARTL